MAKYSECVEAHSELAEIYESTKKTGKAIAHSHDICEPKNIRAQGKPGRLLLRRRDISEVVKCWEKAIALRGKTIKMGKKKAYLSSVTLGR